MSKNRRTNYDNDYGANAAEIGVRSDQVKKDAKYPLLEGLLEAKGLSRLGTYTYRDAAEIFECSIRALQERIREGKLRARDLPGRKKFLCQDLEDFLATSVRKLKREEEEK